MREAGRVSKSRSNRTLRKGPILAMDLSFVHPRGEAVEHDADWYPSAADTRLSVKDIGIGDDHVQWLIGHGSMVSQTRCWRPLFTERDR